MTRKKTAKWLNNASTKTRPNMNSHSTVTIAGEQISAEDVGAVLSAGAALEAGGRFMFVVCTELLCHQEGADCELFSRPALAQLLHRDKPKC